MVVEMFEALLQRMDVWLVSSFFFYSFKNLNNFLVAQERLWNVLKQEVCLCNFLCDRHVKVLLEHCEVRALSREVNRLEALDYILVKRPD